MQTEPIGTTWETWNFEKIKNNIKRNKERRPKYEIVVHQDRVNCQHLENKKDQRSILFDNIEAVSVQESFQRASNTVVHSVWGSFSYKVANESIGPIIHPSWWCGAILKTIESKLI